MPYLCLIIERDRRLAGTFRRELPSFGFKTYLVDSGDAALSMLRQWCFDAVLVDSDSLGALCQQVLRKLQMQSRVPVMLLTGTADEQEQIACLESGATEIVLKPASTRLIAAKLRRLIDIGAHEQDDDAAEVLVGPLAMHARRGRATVEGIPLDLTRHQFELLFLLATRAGQFVPRDAIARALRGPLKEIGRSADVHIYRIRRKLRDLGIDSLRLDTVYGRGYCLSVEGHGALHDNPPVRYPARPG